MTNKWKKRWDRVARIMSLQLKWKSSSSLVLYFCGTIFSEKDVNSGFYMHITIYIICSNEIQHLNFLTNFGTWTCSQSRYMAWLLCFLQQSRRSWESLIHEDGKQPIAIPCLQLREQPATASKNFSLTAEEIKQHPLNCSVTGAASKEDSFWRKVIKDSCWNHISRKLF